MLLKFKKNLTFLIVVFSVSCYASSLIEAKNVRLNSGYNMWLNYKPIQDPKILNYYRSSLTNIVFQHSSKTTIVIKEELSKALEKLLDEKVVFNNKVQKGSLIFLNSKYSIHRKYVSKKTISELETIGNEGYLILNKKLNGNKTTLILANSDIGLLYGSFHLLRLIQTRQNLSKIDIKESPKVKYRIANHWDNLDRSVERGYAGLSIWNWEELPLKISRRYKDYARFCASIGINSVVINNVNADARFISTENLKKIAILEDIFSPYGLKIFIAINFNSPQIIGNLDTADPLNEKVVYWWKKKVEEIYQYIPHMGGFLVKADSEGQPGPNSYGRTHADGANMLAKSLTPYQGVVMWRAFVYGKKQKDRIREAYDEFKPLDGLFDDNVIIQVKKGPLDFMPKEPFSPLLGALKNTNTMIEFQVTQEYLGNENHLLYKGAMYDEILKSDTYAEGKGTLVGDVISGKTYDYKHTGMAGVVNPGMAENWTGHPFVQSSWYAFGRLAWNYKEDPWIIAKDWVKMTFSNNEEVVKKIIKIMKLSERAAVNYREPLGLTHIGNSSHYGPAPWSSRSNYFHQADEYGLGYDRSKTGSNAIAQYNEPLQSLFNNKKTTPEELLLWFHHVSWEYKMKSGMSMWEELVAHYYKGVEEVKEIQKLWSTLSGVIEKEKFTEIDNLLKRQLHDAIIWRDSCVLYFQLFSKKIIPSDYEKPLHELEFYKKLKMDSKQIKHNK